MKISYLYPIKKRVSFNIVAKKHIELLRDQGVEVHEGECHPIKEEDVGDITIVHPIFYSLLGKPYNTRILLKKARKLIGFDVADTDHISPLSAYVASLLDLVIVPSSFSKKIFVESGVSTNVEILPHGVSDVFFREEREPKDPDVKKLQEKRGIKILFFLWHSGFRKGADVLAEAWASLMKKRRDCYLVIKIAGLFDPTLQFFQILPNVIIFNKWLNEDDLVDLYDICDVVVVPSRGGGFELNALESLARGRITIVSSWGAFNDYAHRCLRIRSRGKVYLFKNDFLASVIHDGKGVNPDPKHLEMILERVIDNIETYRHFFEKMKYKIRQEYNWKKIGRRLYGLLKDYT